MKKPKFRGVGRCVDGYTIVEVIIFLAISGALLLSASFLITGRQDRARFDQGIVGLDQRLQDVFNDVATGYYPAGSNFTCTKVPTPGSWSLSNGADESPFTVRINPGGTTEQGENNQCIFIGKLIHFHTQTSSSTFDHNKVEVLSLVAPSDTTGLDGLTGDIVALGFRKSGATPIVPGSVEIFDIGGSIEAVPKNLGNGVFGIVDPRTGIRHHSIAIITAFDGSDPGAGSGGVASRTKLYGMLGWHTAPLGNGQLTLSEYKVNDVADFNGKQLYELTEGAFICLAQDGDGRKAALKITPELKIERTVDEWPASCN